MTIILHDRYDQIANARSSSPLPVGPRREIARANEISADGRLFASPAHRRITWADDDLMSAVSNALTPARTADSARQFLRRLSSTIAKRRR